MRVKQLSFLPRMKLEHGGDTRKGKRKIARPIDPKRPMHVVMRASQARGELSLLHPKNEKHVSRFVYMLSFRYDIKLYRFSNVGNHLHFLLQVPSRKAFQGFTRELAGRIAMWVTGATKSNPFGKFWDKTVYSRVASWGRELEKLHAYLVKNLFEAQGLWDRRTSRESGKEELRFMSFQR